MIRKKETCIHILISFKVYQLCKSILNLEQNTEKTRKFEFREVNQQ